MATVERHEIDGTVCFQLRNRDGAHLLWANSEAQAWRAWTEDGRIQTAAIFQDPRNAPAT